MVKPVEDLIAPDGMPYEVYKVNFVEGLRSRNLILKKVENRISLLDIKSIYVGEESFKEIKHKFKEQLAAAKELELDGVDDILYKYWFNLMQITATTIKLIAFDNIKDNLLNDKPYEDIFNDKYALVLCKRWLNFETFLKEIKEIKFYNLFREEQSIENIEQYKLEELRKLPNLYPSTIYGGSNVFGKDTVDFVSLHEVRDYLKVSFEVYYSKELDKYNLEDLDGYELMEIPSGYLIRYERNCDHNGV